MHVASAVIYLNGYAINVTYHRINQGLSIRKRKKWNVEWFGNKRNKIILKFVKAYH